MSGDCPCDSADGTTCVCRCADCSCRAQEKQMCAEFKRLDVKFGTDARSPLHHDNRCPIHRTVQQSGDCNA